MTMLRTLALMLSISLLVTPSALAQDDDEPRTNPTIKVELANGDVLTGELLESNAESLVIQHPELGDLVVPRSSLVDPDAEALALAVLMPDGSESGVIEVVSPWSGEAELGINGSEGNTDNQTIRANARLTRRRELDIWDTRFNYSYETENNDATEDKRSLLSIYDWLEPGSPWRTYVAGKGEKDRFKDYDYRYSVNAGRAYEFIKNDTTESVGRAGVGWQTQIGGQEDGTDPQGLVAWQFEHAFSDRQGYEHFVSWAPLLNQMDDYILNVRAAWRIDLSDTDPWYLKLGADWDHESEPGDAKANDVDYFAMIGTRF